MNFIAAKVDLAITENELEEIKRSDGSNDFTEHLVDEILEAVRVSITTGRYTIQETA